MRPKLNSALSPAMERTMGESPAHSFKFDAGQLKGSPLVRIEIVSLDGSTQHCDPASLCKWRKRS
jgi:hypothetical protein